MNYKKINLEGFSKYYINTSGQVVKMSNGKVRLLNDRANTTGYRRVSLVNDGGKRVDRYVHRLVALTFIKNPENKPNINHKDGDKANNLVENLEWCTQHENIKHSHNVLKNLYAHEPVDLYYMGKFVDKFNSIMDASAYANENYGASKTSLQKYFTSNGCALIKKKCND